MKLQQILAQTIIDLIIIYPSEYQNKEFIIELNKYMENQNGTENKNKLV